MGSIIPRLLAMAIVTSLFVFCSASAQEQKQNGQKNQKDDGQKNQKDDGQQNQNDDGDGKVKPKVAVLKANQGKAVGVLVAEKNNQKGGVLKAEMVKGKGNQNNQKDDGQQNQKDDGQQNQYDNGQRNQNDDGQKNQKDDGQKNQKNGKNGK